MQEVGACLHGGGGPQEGELTCLGGEARLSLQSVFTHVASIYANLLEQKKAFA